MRYVSTRGVAPVVDFSGVLMAGLAEDGGLYVPEFWPDLSEGRRGDYVETAVDVMSPFVGDSIDRDVFASMVADTYRDFYSEDVVPLNDLGEGLYLLELFHGPTLAFKDLALQLVGRLFDYELSRRGQRVTIVGATSGDTGSAAIEACRDRDNIEIVILHPADRVSDVQRRQMTTVDSENVHNLAIDGTFDDCQDLVKTMFADFEFKQRVSLGAVNSINWARVMAQVVYYVVAAERIGSRAEPVCFAVPTGNFGNVFAGHVARLCGVNIPQLIVASNTNDILTQFFTRGEMLISEVVPTVAPSMDIQISSNLERLIFEVLGRDGLVVDDMMKRFRSEGTISLGPELYEKISEGWTGYRFNDNQVLSCIGNEVDRSGFLLDPHTALGVLAARSYRSDSDHSDLATVVLATAHPAKFPDAVEKATGSRPPLPDYIGDLFDRPEHFTRLPNNLDEVKTFVLENTQNN